MFSSNYFVLLLNPISDLELQRFYTPVHWSLFNFPETHKIQWIIIYASNEAPLWTPEQPRPIIDEEKLVLC